MRMKKVHGWTLAACLALSAAAVDAAKMYRWTDENGNPVVSDRPPPEGTPFTEISNQFTPMRRKEALRNTPASKASGSSMTSRSSSSGNAESTGNAEAATEEPQARVERHPELCRQANDNIFKLETFPRIRVTDADGTVRFMTDEERNAQLETARKVAEANCDS
jgi:hypothetical protein